MNWRRIRALMLRYLFLYRRSAARVGEIVFWPVMDLLVWGFLTLYLERNQVPAAVVYLLGGIILWNILYRSQQALTLALAEEIWVRNLLNVFVAPVTTAEYLMATCLLGFLKAGVTALLLGAIALLLFSFNFFQLGFSLLPFLFNLILFGWSVGICTTALVLRYGQAAEALIWGIPFLIQPLSAVFYPVSILPAWLQPLAYTLPSTFVFEGMRAALAGEGIQLDLVGRTFLLNLLYLGGSLAFFGHMLGVVRERGYLSRLGME